MQTLNLEIDHKNERSGWINCWLTINNERHHLEASYVFPPFMPMLRFIKAIAGQRLPAKFFWDEEGYGADFEATAVPENDSLVHLKITYSSNDAAPWIDSDIERDTVVQAFLPVIMNFSKKFPLAETQWDTPQQLVAKMHKAIMDGFPLRSDTHAPQPVKCQLDADYETPYLEGDIFFRINFEEEDIVSIIMFDTNPLWQKIVDFLGKIASRDLPASCEHIQEIDLCDVLPENSNIIRNVTRLVAEPLDVSDNFRLKIFRSGYLETDFLQLEEVVNRRQFISGFTESFEALLKGEYRMEPDQEGRTFDLRTLPLDKLTNH